MNEANYGKCRYLSVIWEFSKITKLLNSAPSSIHLSFEDR